MKKINFKFLLLGSLVVLTLIYSCSKMLEKPPVGVLLSSTLATKSGVNGLLIGAYSMLDGVTSSAGTGWESGVDNWTYGGIAADDAYKGSNTTDQGTAAPIENHSLDASNEYLEEKWTAWYNCIQRANDAIREVPLVVNGSLTSADGKEIIAEATFIRAVAHMELAKMFRNIPYVDDSISYANKNFNVPNPSPVWDRIETDLMAAMQVLPKTQSDVGRANYYAAEAFLAKAYMFDHQYDKALPLLSDLISNGTTSGGAKYALGAYEDNFNAATKNGTESVFSVQMTVNDGSGGYNDNAGQALDFPAGTYTSC